MGEWEDYTTSCHSPSHFSKVPRSKGMAAAGLQVRLEMRRLFHGLKGKIRFDLPRAIFGGMRHPATIVLRKTLLQVSRAADVTLTGIRQAPQNIRIEHREKLIVKGESLFLSPPPRLRRYGGHPSLALASDGAAIRSSLASEGWWRTTFIFRRSLSASITRKNAL